MGPRAGCRRVEMEMLEGPKGEMFGIWPEGVAMVGFVMFGNVGGNVVPVIGTPP